MKEFDIVVIGGGIAAIECINQLKLELCESERRNFIALVSGGSYVKRIKNIEILSSGLVGMSVNPCGKVNNCFSALILLKVAERSEAKSAKLSFASKYLLF